MSIQDGKHIAIKFTQPLIGDVSGLIPTPQGYAYRHVSNGRFAISALNQNSNTSEYGAHRAVDGSTSYEWRGTTSVNWLKFACYNPKTVSKIRLYYYAHNSSVKTFKFSGSNNGTDWVDLTGVLTVSLTNTSGWEEFLFDNQTPYLYYKMDTLTNVGGTTNVVWVTEIEMYELFQLGHESDYSVSFDVFNPESPTGVESRTVEVETVGQFRPLYINNIPLNNPKSGASLSCIDECLYL